jgi:hypothetical protein
MGYSTSPIQLSGMLGLISILLGIFLVCSTPFFKYIYGYSFSDIPFLQLVILLTIFGIQFILIGLIGETIVEKFVKQETTDIYIKEIV